MSAYLRGYESLAGSYYPHPHFQQPMAAGPLTAYDEFESDDEFDAYMCNVSDDDVVERDIDAEIEARLRDERNSHPPQQLHTPQEHQRQEPVAPASRSVAQRMLKSLQQNRARGRAVGATAPAPASVPVPAPRQHRELDDSTFDLAFVEADDVSVATTERLTDAFDTPLSSRSSSSCTDRLEARISKSFLSRQDSSLGLTAVDETHDVSVLYSGRRTYPAESVSKTDHARLSENTTGPTPQETKMMEILAKERASRAFCRQTSNPEVEHSKQNGGVRFHFQRGSSLDSDALSGRMGRLALTDSSSGASGASQTALVRTRSAGRMGNSELVVLASQLADIETLVGGIEQCMATPAFSALAGRVLREMELLTKTTQQIRTSGTTLILADLAQQQTDGTQALRRLVARAAAVQKRIGILMQAVKLLVV
ncbi:hypothetical protein BBJ28_00022875 [Nothophytophthora sp. Chile5]|nr:hypothetical protein BBJ28_00022875 [Nothophytophthora sp. Chile5]